MIDDSWKKRVDRADGDEADGNDDALVEAEAAGKSCREPATENHRQEGRHSDHATVDVALDVDPKATLVAMRPTLLITSRATRPDRETVRQWPTGNRATGGGRDRSRRLPRTGAR